MTRAESSGSRWRNWARNFSCRPESLHRPGSLAEIVNIVNAARAAGRTLRPVGSGYSYTRLVQTDAVMVSLERYRGIEELDLGGARGRTGTVRVRAGTQLRDLMRALAAQGLALEILGDIDRQTVAGAVATGTHGTGVSLGNLSTLLEELTLVTAQGEVRTFRRGDEAFPAAQVSLGALGVVASAVLRVVPLYRLEIERRCDTLDAVLARLEDDAQSNRNYEFFWFPCSQVVYTKRMNVASESIRRVPTPSRWRRFVGDVVLENLALWVTCRVNLCWPRLRARLVDLTRRCVPRGTVVLPAHEAYATPRLVKHQELEYALPRARACAVLRELAVAFERHGVRTLFPVEVRFTRADDALLSPSAGRDVVYIAVHTHLDEDYREYFDLCEEIFLAHDGRPHWGKLHGLDAGRLATMYPGWDEFERVRRSLDPAGMFLNRYLRRVLGPARTDAPETEATPERAQPRSVAHAAEAARS
jgi:FAD-linked oxidoreductase